MDRESVGCPDDDRRLAGHCPLRSCPGAVRSRQWDSRVVVTDEAWDSVFGAQRVVDSDQLARVDGSSGVRLRLLEVQDS